MTIAVAILNSVQSSEIFKYLFGNPNQLRPQLGQIIDDLLYSNTNITHMTGKNEKQYLKLNLKAYVTWVI